MASPFEETLVARDAERHARLEYLKMSILLDKVKEVGVSVGVEYDLFKSGEYGRELGANSYLRNH